MIGLARTASGFRLNLNAFLLELCGSNARYRNSPTNFDSRSNRCHAPAQKPASLHPAGPVIAGAPCGVAISFKHKP